MLVTIRRRAERSSAPPPTTPKLAKYEPYKPYRPYGHPEHTYASSSYKPYKPYGHSDHPYKFSAPDSAGKEETKSLEQVLSDIRLALPGYSIVRRGFDSLTIEVDPTDVRALSDVLDIKRLSYEFDEDEVAKNCQHCGAEYAPEDARHGLCPHCRMATCDNCGESYRPHRGSCPNCRLEQSPP